MIGNTNSAPVIEIKGRDCISSYLTFVKNSANPNVDKVSAALGKGNEDNVKGIGKALAMYSWFKGETGEFLELQKCNTSTDIGASSEAIEEIINSTALTNFIGTNEYSREKILKYVTGISKTFTSSNVSSSTTFNVTEDMIERGYVHIKYNLSISNGMSSTTGYISLNGVDICRYKRSGSISTAIIPLTLGDYNISTTGNYTLIIGANCDSYRPVAAGASIYNF